MHRILLLPGDGIGPEVMNQGKKLLNHYHTVLECEEALIGGAAIDHDGNPFPKETQEKALRADAVILGAVGGPKWDSLPLSQRPEKGLLAIRKVLGVYGNLRPLDIWEPLVDFSPLKPQHLKEVSFVVVRELTGDVYFGEPRGSSDTSAWNTMIYHEEEVRRIAHMAFSLAQKRRKKVCSVDKANVLESMVFWRKVVTEVHAQYPDVSLTHLYVDNAAMQIIRAPREFDVMLTPNMFGDILSDEAAVLAGSLGLLPSASLGDKHGLYEPIHGSAPDIAGRGIANPIGLILSIAMMFELSLKMPEIAQKIRHSVADVLEKGLRTPDIYTPGKQRVSTDEMGDAIVKRILGDKHD